MRVMLSTASARLLSVCLLLRLGRLRGIAIIRTVSTFVMVMVVLGIRTL